MEPDETGDTSSAASPPATGSNGPIVVDPAFEAMFRDGYTGDPKAAASPPADAEGDRDPSLEAKPKADADGDAAEPDKGKKAGEDEAEAESAEGLSAKAAKRMEALVEHRRKLGEELVQERQQRTELEAKFRLAASEMVRQVKALKERLAQHEDLDSADVRLEEAEGRERLRGELGKTQAQLREQFAKEAAEAKQAALRESFEETFKSALGDAHAAFPHLARSAIKEAFVVHAKENPDYPVTEAHKLFREVAQKLHEKTAEAYEAEFLQKHQARLNAPSPVSARGTVGVPNRQLTDAEIAADLDAKFGAEFFRG